MPYFLVKFEGGPETAAIVEAENVHDAVECGLVLENYLGAADEEGWPEPVESPLGMAYPYYSAAYFEAYWAAKEARYQERAGTT